MLVVWPIACSGLVDRSGMAVAGRLADDDDQNLITRASTRLPKFRNTSGCAYQEFLLVDLIRVRNRVVAMLKIYCSTRLNRVVREDESSTT